MVAGSRTAASWLDTPQVQAHEFVEFARGQPSRPLRRPPGQRVEPCQVAWLAEDVAVDVRGPPPVPLTRTRLRSRSLGERVRGTARAMAGAQGTVHPRGGRPRPRPRHDRVAGDRLPAGPRASWARSWCPVGAPRRRSAVGGFVPGWAGVALCCCSVFAVQFGYPIGFETLWRGRTPGQGGAWACGCVTVEGAPVGMRHATPCAPGRADRAAPAARGPGGADLAAQSPVASDSATSPRARSCCGQRRGAAPSVAHASCRRRGPRRYVANLDVSWLDPRRTAPCATPCCGAPTCHPSPAARSPRPSRTALVGRVAPAPPPGIAAETLARSVAAAVQQRRTARVGGGPGQRSPGSRGPPVHPTRAAGHPALPAGANDFAPPA